MHDTLNLLAPIVGNGLESSIRLRAIADIHRTISYSMMELSVLLCQGGMVGRSEERARFSRQHWAESVGYDEQARDMEEAWLASQPVARHSNDIMTHRVGDRFIFAVWNDGAWELIDGLASYATEAEAEEAGEEYVQSLA